jgi:hypothetical protein
MGICVCRYVIHNISGKKTAEKLSQSFEVMVGLFFTASWDSNPCHPLVLSHSNYQYIEYLSLCSLAQVELHKNDH